jgi:hypothetical protein
MCGPFCFNGWPDPAIPEWAQRARQAAMLAGHLARPRVSRPDCVDYSAARIEVQAFSVSSFHRPTIGRLSPRALLLRMTAAVALYSRPESSEDSNAQRGALTVPKSRRGQDHAALERNEVWLLPLPRLDILVRVGAVADALLAQMDVDAAAQRLGELDERGTRDASVPADAREGPAGPRRSLVMGPMSGSLGTTLRSPTSAEAVFTAARLRGLNRTNHDESRERRGPGLPVTRSRRGPERLSPER